MSTTVGTREKKVETVFENLTPKEKAKYVSDQIWAISVRQSQGFDEEAHQRDIENFINRHVFTLSAPDYIDYITAEKNHDINKWAKMYFYSILWYQDLIIGLLTVDIEQLKYQKEDANFSLKTKYQKEIIESLERHISMLEKWQERLRKENLTILKEVPWDKINANPPKYPQFDLPFEQLLAEDPESFNNGEIPDNPTSLQT